MAATNPTDPTQGDPAASDPTTTLGPDGQPAPLQPWEVASPAADPNATPTPPPPPAPLPPAPTGSQMQSPDAAAANAAAQPSPLQSPDAAAANQAATPGGIPASLLPFVPGSAPPEAQSAAAPTTPAATPTEGGGGPAPDQNAPAAPFPSGTPSPDQSAGAANAPDQTAQPAPIPAPAPEPEPTPLPAPEPLQSPDAAAANNAAGVQPNPTDAAAAAQPAVIPQPAPLPAPPISAEPGATPILPSQQSPDTADLNAQIQQQQAPLPRTAPFGSDSASRASQPTDTSAAISQAASDAAQTKLAQDDLFLLQQRRDLQSLRNSLLTAVTPRDYQPPPFNPDETPLDTVSSALSAIHTMQADNGGQLSGYVGQVEQALSTYRDQLQTAASNAQALGLAAPVQLAHPIIYTPGASEVAWLDQLPPDLQREMAPFFTVSGATSSLLSDPLPAITLAAEAASPTAASALRSPDAAAANAIPLPPTPAARAGLALSRLPGPTQEAAAVAAGLIGQIGPFSQIAEELQSNLSLLAAPAPPSPPGAAESLIAARTVAPPDPYAPIFSKAMLAFSAMGATSPDYAARAWVRFADTVKGLATIGAYAALGSPTAAIASPATLMGASAASRDALAQIAAESGITPQDSALDIALKLPDAIAGAQARHPFPLVTGLADPSNLLFAGAEELPASAAFRTLRTLASQGRLGDLAASGLETLSRGALPADLSVPARFDLENAARSLRGLPPLESVAADFQRGFRDINAGNAIYDADTGQWRLATAPETLSRYFNTRTGEWVETAATQRAGEVAPWSDAFTSRYPDPASARAAAATQALHDPSAIFPSVSQRSAADLTQVANDVLQKEALSLPKQAVFDSGVNPADLAGRVTLSTDLLHPNLRTGQTLWDVSTTARSPMIYRGTADFLQAQAAHANDFPTLARSLTDQGYDSVYVAGHAGSPGSFIPLTARQAFANPREVTDGFLQSSRDAANLTVQINQLGLASRSAVRAAVRAAESDQLDLAGSQALYRAGSDQLAVLRSQEADLLDRISQANQTGHFGTPSEEGQAYETYYNRELSRTRAAIGRLDPAVTSARRALYPETATAEDAHAFIHAPYEPTPGIEALSNALVQSFPHTDPIEVTAAVRLVEANARAAGITPDEWVLRYVAGVRRSSQAGLAGTPLAEDVGVKGATDFLADGRAVITSFESGDISTIAHELGHVFRRTLPDADLSIAARWAGVPDPAGPWPAAAEEKFANGFERYLRNGRAPTAALRPIFARFRDWLSNIYQGLIGSRLDLHISPEMRGVYDRLLGGEEAARPAEAPRSSPDLVNAKTWYHGTRTAGLTPESIDPFRTDPMSLYGQGLYLTDSPDVATGYAAGRVARRGEPTVYEGNVSVNRVLDLEHPLSPDLTHVMEQVISPPAAGEEGEWADARRIITDEINRAASQPGATNGSVVQAFLSGTRAASAELSLPKSEFDETLQDLNLRLKEEGYDALTHTGGLVTGGAPHQVLILLDPNDFAQTGRAGQLSRLETSGQLRQEQLFDGPTLDRLALEQGNPMAASLLREAAENARGNYGEGTLSYGQLEPVIRAAAGGDSARQQAVEPALAALRDAQFAPPDSMSFGRSGPMRLFQPMHAPGPLGGPSTAEAMASGELPERSRLADLAAALRDPATYGRAAPHGGTISIWKRVEEALTDQFAGVNAMQHAAARQLQSSAVPYAGATVPGLRVAGLRLPSDMMTERAVAMVPGGRAAGDQAYQNMVREVKAALGSTRGWTRTANPLHPGETMGPIDQLGLYLRLTHALDLQANANAAAAAAGTVPILRDIPGGTRGPVEALASLRDLQADLSPDEWTRLQSAARAFGYHMDANLQVGVDSGLISDATAVSLRAKYPHYAPQLIRDRYLEDADPNGHIGLASGSGGNAISQASSTLRRLGVQGTADEAINPVYAAYLNMARMRTAAARNDAALTIRNAGQFLGHIQPSSARLVPGQALPPGVMSVMDHGVRKLYDVPPWMDHEIGRLASVYSGGWAPGVLRFITGVLRAGSIGYNATFFIGHFMRDLLSSSAVMRGSPGQAVGSYGGGLAEALKDTLGDGSSVADLYRLMYGGRGGGAEGSSYLTDQTAGAAGRTLREIDDPRQFQDLVRSPSAFWQNKDMVPRYLSFLNGLTHMTELTELASKLSVFENDLRRQGVAFNRAPAAVNPMTSGLRGTVSGALGGRNVIDFGGMSPDEIKSALQQAAFTARRGTVDLARQGHTVQALSQFFFLLNPSVQWSALPLRGFARSIRAAGEYASDALTSGRAAAGANLAANGGLDNFRQSIQAAAYALGGLSLYAYNSQYPEYYDVPAKDRYAGGIIMLPSWEHDPTTGRTVPHYINVLPSAGEWSPYLSIMPWLLGRMQQRDPSNFGRWLSTILPAATPFGSVSSLVPTALQPEADIRTNWDSYYNRPIVPPDYQNLPAPQQYDQYTSEAAKTLGKWLGVSPMMIDHWIAGHFGAVGRFASNLADAVAKMAVPPQIDPHIADLYQKYQSLGPNRVARLQFLAPLTQYERDAITTLERQPRTTGPWDAFTYKFAGNRGGDLALATQANAASALGVSAQQTREYGIHASQVMGQLHDADLADNYRLGLIPQPDYGPNPTAAQTASLQGGPGSLTWKQYAANVTARQNELLGALGLNQLNYPQAAQNDPKVYNSWLQAVNAQAKNEGDPNARALLLASAYRQITMPTLPDGQPDFDRYYQQQQAFVSQASPADRALLSNYLAASRTPAEQQLHDDHALLRNYWALGDQVASRYADWQGAATAAKSLDTHSANYQAVAGTEPYKEWQAALKEARDAYRRQNPAVDAALVRQEYATKSMADEDKSTAQQATKDIATDDRNAAVLRQRLASGSLTESQAQADDERLAAITAQRNQLTADVARLSSGQVGATRTVLPKVQAPPRVDPNGVPYLRSQDIRDRIAATYTDPATGKPASYGADAKIDREADDFLAAANAYVAHQAARDPKLDPGTRELLAGQPGWDTLAKVTNAGARRNLYARALQLAQAGLLPKVDKDGNVTKAMALQPLKPGVKLPAPPAVELP